MTSANAFLFAIGTRWVVDWIMKQSPKRWTQRTATIIAIAVLVLALSPTLYDHIQSQGENFYQLLNVPVESTAKEIKSAYRRASLQYHPDKLGSDLTEEEVEAANVKFQSIRDAYESLLHQNSKSVYDKFGPAMLERLRHQASDGILTQALVDMAVFYVAMSVLTFLMTLGKGSPLARKWSYTGLLLVLVLDVATKFSGWSPARSLFPFHTPFEKCEIVKLCYASFMQGCHVLAAVTYVDKTNLMLNRLAVLETRQRQVLMELRALRQLLAGAKIIGGGASSVASSPANVAQPLPTMRQRAKKKGPGRVSAPPTSGKKDAKNGDAKAAGAAPAQERPHLKIPGWAILIAMYLFYNYVIG